VPCCLRIGQSDKSRVANFNIQNARRCSLPPQMDSSAPPRFTLLDSALRARDAAMFERFADAAAALVHAAWPRSSLATRRRTLDAATGALGRDVAPRDSSPLCVLMLDAEADADTSVVIGHALLSRVDTLDEMAALIESVVVAAPLRGRSLGTLLMRECARIAASRGCVRLYLSTLERDTFYRHLGFVDCAPVTSVGAAAQFVRPSQLASLEALFRVRAPLSNACVASDAVATAAAAAAAATAAAAAAAAAAGGR
jgi:GNAT superfamily N-acetyltransferase